MTLNISSVFTYDEDAGNYIQAVEAADQADTPGIGALEPAVRQAINNFVVGCKQDGIWDAIKASCILAGARTLNGALQPLVGTAPTKNGTPANWNYNRKTGLQGDGNTNYLDSNRANNADPQNSKHLAFYSSSFLASGTMAYIGMVDTTVATPYNVTQIISNNGDLNFSCNSNDGFTSGLASAIRGFVGVNRSASTSILARYNSLNVSANRVSVAQSNLNEYVFARNLNGSLSIPTSSRFAFYSIGESLDLAKLDSRVTDLITAFGAAIP